jgi:glycosyltransferase involved in cell wall biosynthesis
MVTAPRSETPLSREILFYSDFPLGFHMADAQVRMTRFVARGYQVHFVQPLGVRNPGPRHALRIMRVLLPRQARAEGTAVPFDVFSPKLLPPRRAPLVGRLNRAWLARQLLGLIEDPAQTVFWLRYPTPELVPLVLSQPWRAVVYEAIDDHDNSPGMNDRLRRICREAERQILPRAGVVFVSSEPMRERMARVHPNVIRAPAAAVDVAAFAPPASQSPDHRRVAAYAGSIDFRFDSELVASAAERLPDWRFVIAGPVDRRAKGRLDELPNVHLAGRLPAEDIPSLLAGAGVCLMPYREHAFNDAVFPVKLVEYLAAGKPIVSTPIDAIREFGDLVTVGTDPSSFASAIVAAAQSDSEEARARRIERARSFSWESRMDQLQDAVEAAARKP